MSEITGLTPLHYAANISNPKLINELIKNGAEVNDKDDEGKYPLYYAVLSGNVESVKWLIGKGAEVNQDMIEAIQPGVQREDPVYVEINNILKQKLPELEGQETGGDDINKRDNDGKTDLYRAVEGNNGEEVERLINKGANPDISDEEGKTPLYIAVENNYDVIVTLLTAKEGVDPNIQDNEGKTPLFVAAEKGFSEGVTLLLQKKADVNQETTNKK